MGLLQLDTCVRASTATTILLLGWLLFRRQRDIGTPAALFAPLAICLAGFVAGNTPAAALRLHGVAGELAHIASGFTVIFLWWFCLSCFDSRFRVGGRVLVIGLIWAALASAARGLKVSAAVNTGLSQVLVGLGFGIVGHLIWRLASDRPGDLIQRRHDIRPMVAVLLGGQLLIDLSADAIFGDAWRPLAFALSQNIAILGFGLWLAGKTLTARPDVLAFAGRAHALPPAPAPPVESGGGGVDSVLRGRLKMLIQTQRIFLDPDLTFAAFVEQMGAPERVVRRLVNHELGFDHFRTFLNHYRVMEARRRLADPERSGDKLIAIALDSGFASLPSFNRAFRAAESCTPSAYRAAALTATARADPGQWHPAPGFEKRSSVF